MEIINENMLGPAKGTAVEDAVAHNFNGETKEVGLYLAMARLPLFTTISYFPEMQYLYRS